MMMKKKQVEKMNHDESTLKFVVSCFDDDLMLLLSQQCCFSSVFCYHCDGDCSLLGQK